MLKIADLFDLNHTLAKDYLQEYEYCACAAEWQPASDH